MRFSTFIFVLFFFILVSGAHSQSFLQNLTSSMDNVEMARRKRKGGKYMVPILFSALLIKSIVFSLAFKAMSVMSSISVLLSTMSLIISSIVGYIRLGAKSNAPSTVKVVKKRPHNWAKNDQNVVKNYYVTVPMENYNPSPPPLNMLNK